MPYPALSPACVQNFPIDAKKISQKANPAGDIIVGCFLQNARVSHCGMAQFFSLVIDVDKLPSNLLNFRIRVNKIQDEMSLFFYVNKFDITV